MKNSGTNDEERIAEITILRSAGPGRCEADIYLCESFSEFAEVFVRDPRELESRGSTRQTHDSQSAGSNPRVRVAIFKRKGRIESEVDVFEFESVAEFATMLFEELSLRANINDRVMKGRRSAKTSSCDPQPEKGHAR